MQRICRPLPALVAPALRGHLAAILAQLQRSFPPAAACLHAASRDATRGTTAPLLLLDGEDDGGALNLSCMNLSL